MSPIHRRRLDLRVLGLALVLGLGSALAGGQQPAAAAAGFEYDLYQPGDFVAQTNLVQCVGASMQMMVNLVSVRNDRTAATQHQLWALARTLGPPRPPNRPPSQGASVQGWAAGLNQLDQGPYAVVGYPTLSDALYSAARAMRRTGRPVGLLVWGGRHAWVMSGFQATADPAGTDAFRVTHAFVLDPLYPLMSTIWPRSPAPDSRLSVATLAQSFVARRGGWSGALRGMWVIVEPVDARARTGLLRGRSAS